MPERLESGNLSTGIDIGDIKIRMNQMQIQYPYFVQDTLEKLMDDLIIKKIHYQMKQDKISKKIIESTRLDKKPYKHRKKSIVWSIVSDYRSIDGFPVAVMIEHGRKAFFIRPKPPSDDRPRPTLKFEIGKDTIFSKGHRIPAYQAKKYVYETVKDNRKEVKRELNRKTHEFIRAMMGEHMIHVP